MPLHGKGLQLQDPGNLGVVPAYNTPNTAGMEKKHKVSQKPDNTPISSEDEQGNTDSPSSRENASTWARLIKKVKILRHLIRIGRPPLNFTILGVCSKLLI